jgi:hypothetical protein
MLKNVKERRLIVVKLFDLSLCEIHLEKDVDAPQMGGHHGEI